MKRNALSQSILAWLAAGLFYTGTATATKPAGFDAEIETFVLEMSTKHGFDRSWLRQLMRGVEYRQNIIDAISRPAEAKPWSQYRPIFVTPDRAGEGVVFWNNNKALLEQAEKEYGVPPEIIVAIIGVETRYGTHSGKYPVLDSLSTLAFGYPKRAAFFRRQLEEFLLLSREEEIDLQAATGSYAGAMGKPQFIPSSYRSYAVDFDGDGRRDLLQNDADVIGSVAAYFKQHRWRPGDPITSRADVTGDGHQRYLEAGMKPSIAIAELQRAGVQPAQRLPGDALSSLILLEGKGGPEYWLGLHNFYVITRYNHSNLYAMAVYQLSQKISQQRKAAEKAVD